jgi:hypothetical protein
MRGGQNDAEPRNSAGHREPLLRAEHDGCQRLLLAAGMLWPADCCGDATLF